jgi:hypothetical protein
MQHVMVVGEVVVTYSSWGARGECDCDYTEATGMRMRLQPRMLERRVRAGDGIQQ